MYISFTFSWVMFSGGSTNSWWIDSKTTYHNCNYFQVFQLIKRLNEKDMDLTLASYVRTTMWAMVDLTLVLKNKCHLELKDCFCVSESTKSLFSISSLNKCNHSVYFNKSVFIIYLLRLIGWQSFLYYSYFFFALYWKLSSLIKEKST